MTQAPPSSPPPNAAQAKADAWLKDDTLARAKANTPEHIDARKRVAALFCQLHLKPEPSAAREARLAAIDYTAPVSTTNARGLDLNNPKSTGFLGMGRKPAYLVSEKYPPKKAEDPLYALAYFPVKK